MTKTRPLIEKPNTMGELRDELLNLFTDLRNGSIDLKEAVELNNTAGKIINSFKGEMDYWALLKKTPNTDFIEGQSQLEGGK